MYKKVLVNQQDDSYDINHISQNKYIEKGQWKRSLTVNPDTLEYGNKFAEIIDFGIVDNTGIITNNITKGTIFMIKMKVLFNKKIQNPIFAFTIKDLKGTEITGTNTMIEKEDISVIEQGDIKEISFTQNMNIQGGQYLLSLGCTGYRDGDFTVYHRLYDVCNITVVSHKNSIGYYDMNSEVKIK